MGYRNSLIQILDLSANNFEILQRICKAWVAKGGSDAEIERILINFCNDNNLDMNDILSSLSESL